MGRGLEKRGIDYYWFSVTHDKYELPTSGIYDNLTDYALAIGKSEGAIRSAVSHAEHCIGELGRRHYERRFMEMDKSL